MKLSQIKTADQLQVELVRQGWSKSLDDKPCSEDFARPIFCCHSHTPAAISIYVPEHGFSGGINALWQGDGRIHQWGFFCNYPDRVACYYFKQPTKTLELNPEAIGKFIRDWSSLSVTKERLGSFVKEFS